MKVAKGGNTERGERKKEIVCGNKEFHLAGHNRDFNQINPIREDVKMSTKSRFDVIFYCWLSNCLVITYFLFRYLFSFISLYIIFINRVFHSPPPSLGTFLPLSLQGFFSPPPHIHPRMSFGKVFVPSCR